MVVRTGILDKCCLLFHVIKIHLFLYRLIVYVAPFSEFLCVCFFFFFLAILANFGLLLSICFCCSYFFLRTTFLKTVLFSIFILQLTRWRGPGQTWRVRGNIFVAQIRSETPPDMFFILPLLCSATDTPIFCTSGNNHIPSHTDTVRVCWKQSIFSKKSGSVQCNKRSRSDQAKRIYFSACFCGKVLSGVAVTR